MIRSYSIVSKSGITLKVVRDARGSDTLWKHDSTSMNGPTNQELSRLLVQVFGELDNCGIIYGSWKIVDVISERAVGCYNNALQRVNKISRLYENYQILPAFLTIPAVQVVASTHVLQFDSQPVVFSPY